VKRVILIATSIALSLAATASFPQDKMDEGKKDGMMDKHDAMKPPISGRDAMGQKGDQMGHMDKMGEKGDKMGHMDKMGEKMDKMEAKAQWPEARPW
jgi:hypothetical protein